MAIQHDLGVYVIEYNVYVFLELSCALFSNFYFFHFVFL